MIILKTMIRMITIILYNNEKAYTDYSNNNDNNTNYDNNGDDKCNSNNITLENENNDISNNDD